MLLDTCTADRVLLEADLVPMQGQRFQPTGFADLGAAVYTLPDGTRMLLVESAQSMANRLEQTILTPEGTLMPELEGLSCVTAVLQHGKGREVSTSSLLEAHRLASPFIIADNAFQERFCTDAAYDEKFPLDWKLIHTAIFKYDVSSLLHGVFLSIVKGGRIKVPRLISAFIEAENVREAVSGGVKNSFDPSGSIRHADYDKDVYSNGGAHYRLFQSGCERHPGAGPAPAGAGAAVLSGPVQGALSAGGRAASAHGLRSPADRRTTSVRT